MSVHESPGCDQVSDILAFWKCHSLFHPTMISLRQTFQSRTALQWKTGVTHPRTCSCGLQGLFPNIQKLLTLQIPSPSWQSLYFMAPICVSVSIQLYSSRERIVVYERQEGFAWTLKPNLASLLTFQVCGCSQVTRQSLWFYDHANGEWSFCPGHLEGLNMIL